MPLGGALLALLGACGGGEPRLSTRIEAGADAAPAITPPPEPLEAFDADRAWKDLETICGFGERPAGSAAIQKLRRFLEQELRASGLEPTREAFTAETPRGPVSFCNLIAEIPAPPLASGGPGPIVVLSAHYDTKWGMPFRFVGANDGGSETAVLLELARGLAAHGEALRVGFRIVFFDGEESVLPEWEGEDNCYGSRHHVRELQKSGLAARVKAMGLLDMVGDKDLKLTVEQNSDMKLQAAFIGAASRIGLQDHVGGHSQALLDDHIPFLEAGIPAVDLIDFQFGPENSWWHTKEDTLDKCSRKSLEAIGRIVLAGLPSVEDLVLGVRR